MKRKLHDVRLRAVTILIVGIMGSLMLNTALFTHSHVLSDGTIAAHAHPVSQEEGSGQKSNHSHSSLQMFLLNHLETLFPILIASAVLFGLFLQCRISSAVPESPGLSAVRGYTGRAPPTWL